MVKKAKPPAPEVMVSTSVRFLPSVKKALDQAASDDGRTTSQLVQKIVFDWLKERKFLK
jgi:predicted transcriptional regulator